MPIRFQVDGDFYDHPKVLSMSDAAFALWVRAGSYCAAKTTDGFVGDDVLSLFSETQRAAAPELVQRRLWSRVKGGFQFHEFGERNLLRARVEADREYDRERKRDDRRHDSVTRNVTCNACGVTFVTTRSDAKYCSARCRKRASRIAAPQVETQNVRSDVRPDSDRTSDRIPNRSVSVSVSESVSVSGSGQPRGRPRARCPTHEHDPDPPSCLNCRDARRAAEQWDADRRTRGAALPPPSDTARCQLHRGELAHNCRICAAERKAAP